MNPAVPRELRQLVGTLGIMAIVVAALVLVGRWAQANGTTAKRSRTATR